MFLKDFSHLEIFDKTQLTSEISKITIINDVLISILND